jgi:acylphosphatase
MMKKTIHAYISGQVQGVCFRMYTQQQARILGLTGWVKNLPDGRVEIMASGEAEQLKTLQDWLQKGPEMAKVLNVDIKIIETKEFNGFSSQ